MKTLHEIEAAVTRLDREEQESLLAFLQARINKSTSAKTPKTRPLKAASYPPLEGLPTNLSINTKQQVRDLVKRHAADR
jgi:hypothetical protein